MNDRFMYESQPELRPQYVEELYANISEERRLVALLRHVPLYIRRPRVWVSLLVILLLFVACARQFISPEARHAAHINGIDIIETNYIPRVRSSLFTYDGAEEDIESFILSRSEFSTNEQFVIPLEEALTQIPYIFKTPTWVPEGYSLVTEVGDRPFAWRFEFPVSWISEEQDTHIQLVTRETAPAQVKAAPGKWEVVKINGIEVIVIRGRFDALFQSIEEYRKFVNSDEKDIRSYWNDDLGVTLVWAQDGIYYKLGSPGYTSLDGYFTPIQSTDFATEEDLIRMAESMIFE